MKPLRKEQYQSIANLFRTAFANEVWNANNKGNVQKYEYGQRVVEQMIRDFIVWSEHVDPKFNKKKFEECCGVTE